MGEQEGGADDGTRLHALCALPELGDEDVAELHALLEGGADPNVPDHAQRAPLSLLCMNAGHVGAAMALLKAGAKSESSDVRGRTSLHWCCDRGWVTVAELLLGSGAPVNACTELGDTPMLWAAKSGHVKVVELLLKSGADSFLRNNRDEAALDVAGDEVVRTLLSSVVPEPTASAAPDRKPEGGEEAQPGKAVTDVKEKAPVSMSESSVPRTAPSNLGSRALAGLPRGGKAGTSGGVLFSAYTNKQPLSSSSSGSFLRPGPKKMKITLKKKH